MTHSKIALLLPFLLCLISVSVAECPEETYEGILWPATEPGQNVTNFDACGPTADGYVMRVCNEDSTWSNDLIRDCVDRMCPEEILEGITYEETLAGQSVTLQCPDGAQGQITRECALSGEWNDPVNTCVQMCKAESFGGYTWPDTPSGSEAELPCEAGKTGKVTRPCNNGQWGEVQNTCVESFCPETREDVITWPQTPIGSSASPSCPIGMTGSVSRQCQQDGTWSATEGFCDGTRCDAVGAWPQGAGNYDYSLPCPNGQLGQRIRACLPSGEWSEVFDQCETVQCPASMYQGHFYEATQAGETCELDCGLGYQGSIRRACSATGTWEEPVNTCQQTMCLGHVFELPSGSYNVSLTAPNTTPELPCNSGYEGTVTFSCSSLLTWGEPIERCEQIGCGATVITGVEVGLTSFGDSVEAICPEGWLGEFNCTCSLRGEWEVISPCERIQCAASVVGSYNWPQTNAGETASLSCSEKGPNYEGTITLLCGLEGEWEGTPQEDCTEKQGEVEPGTFSYADSIIMTVKHQPIESRMPTIAEGTYSFGSKPFLPAGIKLDSKTGEISGTPVVEVTKETTYTINASSGTSELSATVRITVNSNVCNNADGEPVMYSGQTRTEKCDFLGNKKTECKLDDSALAVVLQTDDGQCTTFILVFVIVIVVIVLILVIVMLVLIKGAGGGIRYDQKKAQRKMAELAYV